jgi:hypothetical protein
MLPNTPTLDSERSPKYSIPARSATWAIAEFKRAGIAWRWVAVAARIAAWLSERVGPTGHVLVTDIDTRFLETLNLPNMEVRRHNIASDSLPLGAFGEARMVSPRLRIVSIVSAAQVSRTIR